MQLVTQLCHSKTDPQLLGRTFAADGSAAAPAPPPVSLDTFLAIHTSEDNASFSDIMADTAEKKRQKQPWLQEDKNQVGLLRRIGGSGCWPG